MTYREVLRQASMLAFNDAFLLLAIATFSLLALMPLLKKSARPLGWKDGVH